MDEGTKYGREREERAPEDRAGCRKTGKKRCHSAADVAGNRGDPSRPDGVAAPTPIGLRTGTMQGTPV